MVRESEMLVCGTFTIDRTAKDRAKTRRDRSWFQPSQAGSGALYNADNKRSVHEKCISFAEASQFSGEDQVVFGTEVEGAKVCSVMSRGFKCKPVTPGSAFKVGPQMGATTEHYQLSDKAATAGVLAVIRGDNDNFGSGRSKDKGEWSTIGQGHITSRHGSIQRMNKRDAEALASIGQAGAPQMRLRAQR